jgi:nanoRNase/pAp phosphatase (c-di-AMP/oligoRNAs hydrolase)
MDKENNLENIINLSTKILLVTNTRPTLDSIASIFLMWHFITVNFKKTVNIYIQNFPYRFEYLFNYSMLEQKDIITQFLREYKLSIKKQNIVIDHVKYNTDKDNFNFSISLKKGALELSSIDLKKASFEYDLIITLDTENLNFLGDIYKTYKSDFESNIKIINIDSHPGNLKYGDLNIISEEYSSTSEIVFNIMSEYNSIMSKKEYQLVLMSILSNTENLSSQYISMKTFQNLSLLQSIGGNLKSSLLEINSPSSIEDLKVKANILKNISEYKNNSKNYIYSIISKGEIMSSYLNDIVIKDIDLVCIGIKSKIGLKIYIKDLKNVLTVKLLIEYFEDVKYDQGVYIFSSSENNIENILERISKIKPVS